MNYKIAITGTVYIGLSNRLLWAQHSEVVALDIIAEKVDMINQGIFPVEDKEIKVFLKENNSPFEATLDKNEAYRGADFVIISAPTDCDPKTNFFNTRSIEVVVQDVIMINIVGEKNEHAETFVAPLAQGADIIKLFADSTEAEAIKLFSNTYPAMRIVYFNGLDSYAEVQPSKLQTNHWRGCLDPRIWTHHDNPFFGYGGCHLPKNIKQPRTNHQDVLNSLIDTIVDTSSTRKNYIADSILGTNPNVVEIDRLVMKSDLDNFRASAIQGITKRIKAKDILVEFKQIGPLMTLKMLRKKFMPRIFLVATANKGV